MRPAVYALMRSDCVMINGLLSPSVCCNIMKYNEIPSQNLGPQLMDLNPVTRSVKIG